jgi:glycosyltransferase involved in cell wall biosynthesis
MILSKELKKTSPTLSVILPCRNEEQAIGLCLENIKTVLAKNKLLGEIIVSDSSVDHSPDIAKNLADKVVTHNKIGYGAAYLEAFPHAKGKYIFMADADGTYDFEEIPRFVNELEKGADLVIGNRLGGKIKPGAMPRLHRYIGTPFLSWLFRLFFEPGVDDINCGMRALKLEALQRLDLKTTGMEFASEMLIESIHKNLKIKQLPIDYYPRIGKSKLKTFSDGKRHLFFMCQSFIKRYA